MREKGSDFCPNSSHELRHVLQNFSKPQQVAEDLQTYFYWVTLLFQQCRRQAAKQANARRRQ
jgi:hypothetical protein